MFPPSRVAPAVKRTIAFFDGQNLFHQAKEAFGYTYPNYNPLVLAQNICRVQGWQLNEVRFYTGVPDAADDLRWHTFWTNKLQALRWAGVVVRPRPLRYRDKVTHWPGQVRIRLPGGMELPAGTSLHRADGTALPHNTQFRVRAADEKGIDIRLALDVFKGALDGVYDVALIFSQDQDLQEVAEEIPVIARAQGRWIRIASAFPDSPACRNHRGVNRTQWIPLDQATYEAAIDPFDYRTGVPPAPPPPPPPPPP